MTSIPAKISDMSAKIVPIVKAKLIGTDVATSNVEEPSSAVKVFTDKGALDPPFDPETLCLLLEHSNALRQNIDAYMTNIDGFGHQFVPVIDLKSDDADEMIANAMFIDALHDKGGDLSSVSTDDLEQLMPSAEEIAERKKDLANEMRREKSRLNAFFGFCCPDTSFVTLRRKMRQDKEIMGNAYWEILRNAGGSVGQFIFVPGFSMRLLPFKTDDIVEVESKVKISEFTFDTITTKRQFRRYVQVLDGRAVHFKEFGDPRVISSATGIVYKTEALMKKEESEATVATEILHFRIHNPRTPYGVPRWIGNLLAVLGSRQAEEVNFLYFENKSIPPLAILVSGGRMTEETIARISDYVDNEIRGKRNFHKILFLEADSDGPANAGKTKIEIKPLTQAQQSDALFQNYDARNIDKIGMSFRLPRMLRGDVRDFNRSTAEAALEFAEMQVFQPEREEFDWIINRNILTDMGIKFWKFESNGPTSKDPTKMTELIEKLVKVSVLTPGEGRELAEAVFNRNFRRIDEFWANQPIALTTAGFVPENAMVDDDANPDTPPTPLAGKAEGDLSTGDLDEAGGLQPAQGLCKPNETPEQCLARLQRERSRFLRLPPVDQPKAAQVDVQALAVQLLTMIETLRSAEKLAAEQMYFESKDAADDVDIEKKVVLRGGEYCVISEETGRSFGCFATRAEAEARLRQIERFGDDD